MAPRLIVLLDAPADEVVGSRSPAGTAVRAALERRGVGATRQAVLEEADKRDVGPVLRAGGDDAEPSSPKCWQPYKGWSRMRSGAQARRPLSRRCERELRSGARGTEEVVGKSLTEN